MSDYVHLNTLTSPQLVVVDLDTGAVVGKNLAVAYFPTNTEASLMSSDVVKDWVTRTGIPLSVDLHDV